MVNTNPFDAALKEARKALREAYEERSALEQRIVSLTKTIEGLAALCAPEVADEFLLNTAGDPSIFQITSLTDAIRQVFSTCGEPMLTPTEIRDALVARGLDLSKYKQPLVPIHNTLKRLASQEEIVEFRDDSNNFIGYRWVSPLARAVAEVSPIRHPVDHLRQRSRNALADRIFGIGTPVDPEKLPDSVRGVIHPKADIPKTAGEAKARLADAMRKIKDQK
jgi:hypothetical protein